MTATDNTHLTAADADGVPHFAGHDGPPPRVGAARLLVALMQGAVLYWLYRAGVDKLWPASVPLLFVPLVLVSLLCPVLLVASLGHLPARRLLLWVGGAALLVAALGCYDAWRTVYPAGQREAPLPSPLLFVHLVVSLFIGQVLIVAGHAERRRVASYGAYFDGAWTLAVQLVFSAGFVGISWLVLNMGSELFKLIKLTFLEDALRHAWFNIPVLVFAFTCAVHLTDVRPAIVRGMRGLVLVLMSWLLPVVSLLVAGFLLSLPFTGLAPLWATRHAAAVLLGAAGALVVMINAAWQNGATLASLALPLRASARVAAVLLAPLVLIASWALGLRVSDHGWTDERIVAAACIVVAACYAAGYLLAALRSASLARIGGVNIATAYVVLALILALFSPLLDPARLSVANQLARLDAGKVSAAQFDYAYLRFHGRRFGRAALASLAARAGVAAAGVRAGAARALAEDYPQPQRPQLLAAPALQANLRPWPAGASLPPGFVAAIGAQQAQYGWPNCLIAVGKSCDVFAIDLRGEGGDGGAAGAAGAAGAGGSDLLLVDSAKGGNAMVFTRDKGGAWRAAERLPGLAGCAWFRQRLIAGQWRAQAPRRRTLEVDGVALPALPEPGRPASCPPS